MLREVVSATPLPYDSGPGSESFIVLMADPNWNNGFYYDGAPPHTGMKLARRWSIDFHLNLISHTS